MNGIDINEYINESWNQFFRPLGFWESTWNALREGTSDMVRGMAPSNMQINEMEAAKGLPNEKLAFPIYGDREEAINRMIDAERDRQKTINAIADYIAPAPHADPETWYGRLGYNVAKLTPEIAVAIPQFSVLGPYGYAAVSTLRGNQAAQEQVYDNLTALGATHEEAYKAATDPLANAADLLARGGTNFLTMRLLGKAGDIAGGVNPNIAEAVQSPLGQVVKNITGASLVSGTGAAGEQALTNYRSGIDNELPELVKIGAIAGGTTAGIGLLHTARNWRNLRNEQSRYNEAKPIEAEWREVNEPFNGEVIVGEPPVNNVPQLTQGTPQLPEYGTSGSSIARRYNDAITKRGFTPTSNNFQPNASAREIAAYINNGYISHNDAVNMLVEGGLTPEQADVFINGGLSEITPQETPQTIKETTQFTAPAWSDPLALRHTPEAQQGKVSTPEQSPIQPSDNESPKLSGENLSDMLRHWTEQKEKSEPPQVISLGSQHIVPTLERPTTVTGIPKIDPPTAESVNVPTVQPPVISPEEPILQPNIMSDMEAINAVNLQNAYNARLYQMADDSETDYWNRRFASGKPLTPTEKEKAIEYYLTSGNVGRNLIDEYFNSAEQTPDEAKKTQPVTALGIQPESTPDKHTLKEHIDKLRNESTAAPLPDKSIQQTENKPTKEIPQIPFLSLQKMEKPLANTPANDKTIEILKALQSLADERPEDFVYPISKLNRKLKGSKISSEDIVGAVEWMNDNGIITELEDFGFGRKPYDKPVFEVKKPSMFGWRDIVSPVNGIRPDLKGIDNFLRTLNKENKQEEQSTPPVTALGNMGTDEKPTTPQQKWADNKLIVGAVGWDSGKQAEDIAKRTKEEVIKQMPERLGIDEKPTQEKKIPPIKQTKAVNMPTDAPLLHDIHQYLGGNKELASKIYNAIHKNTEPDFAENLQKSRRILGGVYRELLNAGVDAKNAEGMASDIFEFVKKHIDPEDPGKSFPKSLGDTPPAISPKETEQTTPTSTRTASNTNAQSPELEAEMPHTRLANRVKSHIINSMSENNPVSKMDKKELFSWAAEEFGGSEGEGKFTARDAFDAMEMGINLAIKEAGIDPSKADTAQKATDDVRKLSRVLQSIPTQTDRTSKQIQFQQFSTPPTLAYLVNWLAGVKKGDIALEPSAGNGGLAVFAGNSGAKLILNELDGTRAGILKALELGDVTSENAEHIGDILNSKLPESERPNVVIMNPPFSSSGTRGTANSNKNGYKHVESALSILKDGGRLVAILGAGRDGTGQTHDKWLKHIGKKYNVRAAVNSDGKAYQKYGTTFGNTIVVIDKTGATPENSTLHYTFDGDWNPQYSEPLFKAFEKLHNNNNNAPEQAAQKEPGNIGEESSQENDIPEIVEKTKEPEFIIDSHPTIEQARSVLGKFLRSRPNAEKYLITDFSKFAEENGLSAINIRDIVNGLIENEDISLALTAKDDNEPPLHIFSHDEILNTPDEIEDEEEEDDTEEEDDIFETWIVPIWRPTPVNVREFKKAYDEVSKFFPSGFVNIVKLRRKLDWGRKDFDDMIKLLQFLRVIQLHEEDPSLMREDEVKDAYIDNSSGLKYIIRSITWQLPDAKFDELEKALEMLRDSNPKSDSKKVTAKEEHAKPPKSSTPATSSAPSGSKAQPKQNTASATPAKPKIQTVNISAKTDKQISAERKAERKKEKESGKDESVLSTYKPTYTTKGVKPHPADLVESTALRAVKMPEIKEAPQIPKEIIESGKLSDAQMEAVALAVNSFSHTLPNGDTRGFFIGDGTGVGKGREISGIILDTLNRGLGKGKAVWLSEKHSLANDAKRDWQGIGGNPDDIFSLNDVKVGDKIDKGKGILFTAYTHMSGLEAKDQRRIKQMREWLGEDFDGIIVLDECHNVNNVIGDNPSVRAINTRSFIREFPKARVLYVSATGATEIANLAMLDRLGLWGYDGAPFGSYAADPATVFVETIAKGGVAAMETVTRDLKAMGLYISRSLSMRAGPNGGSEDVTFRTLEHKLNDEEIIIYDTLASAWQMVIQNLGSAMKACGYKPSNSRTWGRAKSAFWSAHQRFFNQIITSMQTDETIKDIQKQLQEGNCAVVQLTNTMEAALNKALGKTGDSATDELDLSPKEMLINFVREIFKDKIYAVEEYNEDGVIKTRRVKDSSGNDVLSGEAVAIRDNTIKLIEGIKRFPDSPIDKIIKYFGTDRVAEVTGRTKRPEIVDGKLKIAPRNKAITQKEVRDFNNGDRDILIFSEAGGTGASYHASNDFKNKRKRIHYLLQAGWRADKAIQGLGRSHRSNEAHKPEYVLVTTDIPGQKRFISTIARRLAQLGALSSGERKATSGGLFSENDNLEASYVGNAINNLLTKLSAHNNPYTEIDTDDVFTQMGYGSDKQSRNDVRTFLNKILSLKVDSQKKIFTRFLQEINIVKEQYEAQGIDIDEPTETVHALKIEVEQESVVLHNSQFGTDSSYMRLELTQPMKPLTWKEVIDRDNGTEFYTLNSGQIVAAVRSKNDGFDPNTSHFYPQYTLLQPDRRKKEYGVRTEVLDNVNPNQKRKFTRIEDKNEAKRIWEEQLAALPETFTSTENLITGAMIPIWKKLSDSYPKIWRITTDDGREFLGRLLKDNEAARLLKELNIKLEKKSYTPETFKEKLNPQGTVATMAQGDKIKFSRVNGERLIEVIPVDWVRARTLTGKGLIEKIIASKTRYFIPNGNDELLDDYINGRIVADDFVTGFNETPDAEEILNEAADYINSSIPDSNHLYFIHPSFWGFAGTAEAADNNPYVSSSKYAFSNPETERRFQKSKEADDNKKSWRMKLRELGSAIWKGRKEYPEIAGDEKYIDAQEIFRSLKRGMGASTDQAIKRLRAITLHLTPDDYDLFERAMILMDLNETHNRDIDARMPYSLNPSADPSDAMRDPVREEFAGIMAHVRKNKRVQEAIEKAETIGEELRNELLNAADELGMYELRDKLKRKHYFRHLVLEYYNMHKSTTPRPTFRNPAHGGYTKAREGSDKDISSNWLLSMGEVYTRMINDIQILGALYKLRKKYDIINGLKEDAFKINSGNALNTLIRDLKDVPEELRGKQAKETLNKKLHAKQSRAMEKLFSLAARGDLPVGDNNEWAELAGRMADAGQLERLSREEQQNLARYIGWLATLKEKTKAQSAATSVLTAEKGKNAALRDILGDDYVDWKELIPEDYTLWTPSNSPLVFSAGSVPENVLKLAMASIDDMLGVPVSELGAAISSGGIQQLWCIPEKLASTLNELGKKQAEGALAPVMRPLMNGFKQWVTIGPRIVIYNWRNWFGDLEAVLQGNPGALKHFIKAKDELVKVMLKGGMPTGDLEEFFKRGGGSTTEFVTELEHPERLREFAHLFDKKPQNNPLKWIPNLLNAYISFARTYTNFRECVLRYASFLSYLQQIRDNNGVPPFYGMSNPDEVKAVGDNAYDIAFKLSNENLGAYDQLSKNMQWLRDNFWLSFGSWLEVNFKRSLQMYKNIWTGNHYLEYWIKKNGKKLFDVMSGGGGNNGKEPPNNGGGGGAGPGDDPRFPFRRFVKKSPDYALRFAITLAMAAPLWIICALYNWLTHGEADGSKIILSRNSETGEEYSFSNIGSAMDFLETVGVSPLLKDLRDLFDGRKTLMQVAVDIADGPLSKVWNNFNPFAKTALESLFKKRTFPSVLHPTPIRDRTRYLAQSFGAEWYYDYLTGKAHKPFVKNAAGAFANVQNQNQSAYFHILSRKRQFEENVLGKTTDTFTQTKRGEALRNARKAAELGDKKALRKYLREYYIEGGTDQGRKTSVEAMNPLHGLNERDRMRFIKWLPKDERTTLRKALKYYEKEKSILAP